MVRAFLALFAAASAAVAQPSYDILIKGGHVIDPKNNFDTVADVAVVLVGAPARRPRFASERLVARRA